MALPPPRPWISSLAGGAVWLAALVAVYALGAQDVFYKTDGPYLVFNLAEGRCTHPYNVLYMPLACTLHGVLEPLGATAYDSAMALSVVGTALGVGLAHVVFARSGLRGARLWLASSLVAAAPPVAFFATVVEHHGPFLPFAAATFLLTVELARRPSWWLAAVLGCATHVAYLVHGTGNLLPGLLLPLFLAWRSGRGTLRHDLVLAAIAGAVHLALFIVLRDVELPGGGVEAALENVVQEGIGQPRGLEYVPAVLLDEWLWPYLPLSASWLLGLVRREGRLEAAALAVGLVPYVAICALLIVGEPEFGAYLLPLAIPAARITVLALPSVIVAALVGWSAVMAVLAIRTHDDDAAQRAFADGARSAFGDRPAVLLMGGPDEVGFAMAELPAVERFLPIEAAAQVTASEADVARLLAVFDAYVAAKLAEGKTVWFTAGAEREVVELPAGPALLQHVERAHAAERVEVDAFRALRITR